MLDGLDNIRWCDLRHAYGSAGDVPSLLRSLTSGEDSVRNEAISDLFGNIWTQGTVYEATIYAIPFLIELLEAPEIEGKPGIASLLASIADGHGYIEVHARPEWFESEWKSLLAKKGKKLDVKRDREQEIVERVHDASRPCLPVILPYLMDQTIDADARSCIPAAFAAFPELSSEYLPVLERLTTMETDTQVLEELQRAIERLRSSSRTE